MFSFLKTQYQKIRHALKKTSSFLGKRLRGLFARPLDENTLEELEQTLYEADLGSACVSAFIDQIERFHKKHPEAGPEELIKEMETLALNTLNEPPRHVGRVPEAGTTQLILIVGVNGSGKTTTIAKLAKRFQAEGKKVLLAAGDTFRAAASDQLAIWAERLQVEIVKGPPGGDPSSVLFEAMAKARAQKADILLCDTAGRLESKTDLMRELEKMQRIAQKQDPLAPHEVFLIIDVGLGQTAIEQAKVFHQYVPLTGLILTKIDGTAKGGVALAIYKEMGIPIHYIGVGEQMDDLLPFDPQSYTEALFHE